MGTPIEHGRTEHADNNGRPVCPRNASPGRDVANRVAANRQGLKTTHNSRPREALALLRKVQKIKLMTHARMGLTWRRCVRILLSVVFRLRCSFLTDSSIFKNAMETAPDSPLPLNCPKCPRRMKYVTATGDGIHVYVCAEHGAWQLGPGGIHRPPLPVQAAG